MKKQEQVEVVRKRFIYRGRRTCGVDGQVPVAPNSDRQSARLRLATNLQLLHSVAVLLHRSLPLFYLSGLFETQKYIKYIHQK